MERKGGVLVEVHLNAARRWASDQNDKDSQRARELLEKIHKEEPKYDRVVVVEGGVHGFVDAVPTPYDWEAICIQLDPNGRADVSGVQKSSCVRKTLEELGKRGFKTRLREDLTFDCQ